MSKRKLQFERYDPETKELIEVIETEEEIEDEIPIDIIPPDIEIPRPKVQNDLLIEPYKKSVPAIFVDNINDAGSLIQTLSGKRIGLAITHTHNNSEDIHPVHLGHLYLLDIMKEFCDVTLTCVVPPVDSYITEEKNIIYNNVNLLSKVINCDYVYFEKSHVESGYGDNIFNSLDITNWYLENQGLVLPQTVVDKWLQFWNRITNLTHDVYSVILNNLPNDSTLTFFRGGYDYLSFMFMHERNINLANKVRSHNSSYYVPSFYYPNTYLRPSTSNVEEIKLSATNSAYDQTSVLAYTNTLIRNNPNISFIDLNSAITQKMNTDGNFEFQFFSTLIGENVITDTTLQNKRLGMLVNFNNNNVYIDWLGLHCLDNIVYKFRPTEQQGFVSTTRGTYQFIVDKIIEYNNNLSLVNKALIERS